MRNVPMPMVIAVALIVVIAIATIGLRFFRDDQENQALLSTSDRGEIVQEFTVAMDAWVGYMPLCSSRLAARLRARNISLRCQNDNADYAQRMQQLARGEIDFAVSTVDANITNGGAQNFPGVVVSVLDQSQGGDAIVAWTDEIANIDALGTTDGWQIAFTPNSPSHHLLRSVGSDFSIDTLLSPGDWRVETDGAQEALRRFRNREVSVAVLWQPHVAAAVADGATVIHSSASTDKVIVDVLLANRRIIRQNASERQYIGIVLEEYFETLRELREDRELMVRETRDFIRTYAGGRASAEEINVMLDGVTWINLRDNAEAWFGVGGSSPYYGLGDAHDFALRIIRAEEGADYQRYFTPEGVIQNDFIQELYVAGGYQGEEGSTITNSLRTDFAPLADAGWSNLQQVAFLRSRPVIFMSGETQLEERSREALGEAMGDLERYPTFRVELRIGYDANDDDVVEAQNRARARAETVRQYLIDTYGLDADRLRVYVPSPSEVAEIIPRRSGESTRSYRARFRQVQLVLMTTPL